MHQEYYQIYENQHPLVGQTYPSCKEARKALKDIYEQLSHHGDTLGFKVEKRMRFLRNILGVRRIYADGSQANFSYVIHHVKLQPVYAKM